MTAAFDGGTWIRPWLRLEGMAVLGAGLAGFLALGLPWYLFAVLLLVPDLSAAGYLRGPRVGAIVYNVVHDMFTGRRSRASAWRSGPCRSWRSARSSSRTAGWTGRPATA